MQRTEQHPVPDQPSIRAEDLVSPDDEPNNDSRPLIQTQGVRRTLQDLGRRAPLIWRSVNSRFQHSGFLNATKAHLIKRVGERLESPHFLFSKNCFARSLPYAIMLQMKLGLRSSFEE
jgi:hypothetical protein